MVVRDHAGNLVFFGSSWEQDLNPQAAECKAFVWAAQIAIDNRWANVDWRSDAKFIIDQVVGCDDPGVWETRNGILSLN